MRVAIMQPYLFPYIGYFQLINAVDRFVLLDDVNYIKKGWINRNRILLNSQPHTFTLPLAKSSQNKKICDLQLTEKFGNWIKQFLVIFRHAYSGAPGHSEISSFLERMMAWPDLDLVDVLERSLQQVCKKLGIATLFSRSSRIGIDPELRGQERIIELCRQLGATDYINLSGGRSLYHGGDFARQGIRLHFLEAVPKPYRQFADEFVPLLSILDVMTFKDAGARRDALAEFSLTSVGCGEL